MFEELYTKIKSHKLNSSESSYLVAMESVKDIFIGGRDISELSDEDLYELLKNVPTEDEDGTLESMSLDPIRSVLDGDDVDDHTLESVCSLILGRDDI